MVQLCISGLGKMGQRVLALVRDYPDIEVVSGHDPEITSLPDLGLPRLHGHGTYGAALEGADAVLIFHGDAPSSVVQAVTAAEKGIAVVIGTTGFSQEQLDWLKNKVASRVPVVWAPNFSQGANVLFWVVSEVASILGAEYAVEIIEIHHDQKKDSPSGTAKKLGQAVADARGLVYEDVVTHGRVGELGSRPEDEIGMHAVRGGDVCGEHTVSFFGQGERLELTHKAHTRDNFAHGALRAVKWVSGKGPGWYSMQKDVLGLK